MRNVGTPQAGIEGSRFSLPLIPALRDGFGERWFTTLAADGTRIELLQLHRELVGARGFEESLRGRIAQLKGFTNPAFPSVLDLYQDNSTLTLVSTRGSGQRLSELTVRDFPRANRPILVARMLQNATDALAALENVAPGVTHGALTPDRILVTPEGEICITEHVFGSALQELALWPEELFLQFGVLASTAADGQATFDPRTTVMQLGTVALSVLLERPVTLDDFDHDLNTLIDELATNGSAASAPAPLIDALRTWLERALQVNAPGYLSAVEARAGLPQVLAAAGPAAGTKYEPAPFPTAHPRLVGRADHEKRVIQLNPDAALVASDVDGDLSR